MFKFIFKFKKNTYTVQWLDRVEAISGEILHSRWVNYSTHYSLNKAMKVCGKMMVQGILTVDEWRIIRNNDPSLVIWTFSKRFKF